MNAVGYRWLPTIGSILNKILGLVIEKFHAREETVPTGMVTELDVGGEVFTPWPLRTGKK